MAITNRLYSWFRRKMPLKMKDGILWDEFSDVLSCTNGQHLEKKMTQF